MKHVYALMLVFACVMWPVASAMAQQSEVEGTPIPTYRLAYVPDDELTSRVFVIGGTSGVYEIGLNTQLDELLVAVAGDDLGEVTSGEHRRMTVRVYRLEGDRRRVIYEAPVERVLRVQDDYPQLQDGDIFEVETVVRQRFGWRDGLAIFSSLATIASLIAQFAR